MAQRVPGPTPGTTLLNLESHIAHKLGKTSPHIPVCQDKAASLAHDLCQMPTILPRAHPVVQLRQDWEDTLPQVPFLEGVSGGLLEASQESLPVFALGI